MKKVKWLCLGMLLVLCLGAFFACGDNNGGSATIDHELVKGTHWEGVNQFEGEKLKISLSVEQYNNKSTIPSSDRYIRGSNGDERQRAEPRLKPQQERARYARYRR